MCLSPKLMICPSSSPTHHIYQSTPTCALFSPTHHVTQSIPTYPLSTPTHQLSQSYIPIIHSDTSSVNPNLYTTCPLSTPTHHVSQSNRHIHYSIRHSVSLSPTDISIIQSDTACLSVHTDISVIHCSNPHSFAKLMTGVILWEMHSLALDGHPASGHSADHRPPSCAAVHRAH